MDSIPLACAIARTYSDTIYKTDHFLIEQHLCIYIYISIISPRLEEPPGSRARELHRVNHFVIPQSRGRRTPTRRRATCQTRPNQTSPKPSHCLFLLTSRKERNAAMLRRGNGLSKALQLRSAQLKINNSNNLKTSLKSSSPTLLQHQHQQHRPASTTTTTARTHSHDIAILGGGITGLATAYFITQQLPRAKVTVYEAGERIGGWLESRRVEVEGGGNVLFEAGPRTLRPAQNGVLAARLVSLWLFLGVGGAFGGD